MMRTNVPSIEEAEKSKNDKTEHNLHDFNWNIFQGTAKSTTTRLTASCVMF